MKKMSGAGDCEREHRWPGAAQVVGRMGAITCSDFLSGRLAYGWLEGRLRITRGTCSNKTMSWERYKAKLLEDVSDK